MTNIVHVVDYNPTWPQQFKVLKEIYVRALGDHFFSIEHVGSTSVPGLAAKPILDIDIIVKDDAQLNQVIKRVSDLGYQFVGDLGIKDRYAFKAISDHSPENGTGDLRPQHNLYCCLEGSTSLDNHLHFRNALLADPALALEYAELKKRLASMTTDIDVYVESKSAFITSVLERAGISADHVRDIIAQNKKK